MIAQELEVSLHMAFVEARQQRHEFITVEHLLLALLDNPSAAEVLKVCAANIDDLRKSLTTFIKENTPTVSGSDEVDTQPTLGFQRVIQHAIMYCQNKNINTDGASVLLAIFGEKDSYAILFLHAQDITRFKVKDYIEHGIKKSEPPEPTKGVSEPGNTAAVVAGMVELGVAAMYRIEIKVIPPQGATTDGPALLGFFNYLWK